MPSNELPGDLDETNSEQMAVGERTFLNKTEGGMAWLGENILTLFAIAFPTMVLWMVVARMIPTLAIPVYIIGGIYAAGSATFLFAKYDWMTNRGFVAMITRFYTQTPELLFDRFPDESGIEQPKRNNIAARLSRKPILRSIPVFGEKADEENRNHRPHDLVPMKRSFKNSPAIESEREDRRTGRDGQVKTVLGAIRIEPPNIVTDDTDSWRQSAKWFATALDTAFEGSSQLYEPMRSADYEARVHRYRARENEIRRLDRFNPNDTGTDVVDAALADYAQERGDNVSLRDITALVRDYYVVHEVTPLDVVTDSDLTSGGIASVPLIGYLYKEYKAYQLQQSEEYMDEMADHLEYRLDEMAKALQRITDLRCSVVPSEHYAQAVADHYNAANMYAMGDFTDIIRQSPQPSEYAREHSLTDVIEGVPEGFENPEHIGSDLSPEMRRILDIDDPAEGADTGLNQPDPGAKGMAEYGVAWDHMTDHPMVRAGVLPDDGKSGAGEYDPAGDVETAAPTGTGKTSTRTTTERPATADGGVVTDPGGANAEMDTETPGPDGAPASNVDELVTKNGGPIDFDIVDDYEGEEFQEWFKSLLCAEDNVGRGNPNYITIDDQQFSATMMITRWPPDIDPGFLEPVLRFEDPTVSVFISTHIHGLDQNKLEMELADEEDEKQSKVQKIAGSRFPVFLERFKNEWQAAKEMLESVTRSDHDTFETQTYLEVRAYSPESLYKAIDKIKGRLRDKGAQASLLKHNHEKGHQTVAPICDDKINHSVKARSDGIGCLNPWTVRNLYDENGVEIGENMSANEPLAYDFWKRTLAPHFGMWTKSGGGKTTMATIMFSRLLTLYPDEFFFAIVDPLQEFVNLSEIHDGHRIVLGGDAGMNPLHGSPTPEDKLSAVGRKTPYKEWKAGGTDFLALYYDALEINFTSGKRTVWSKAIKMVGEKHGITKDPQTLDPEHRERRTQSFYDTLEEQLTAEQLAAFTVDGGDSDNANAILEEFDIEIPADVADPGVDPTAWPTLLEAIDIIEDMSDDAAKPEYVANPENDRQVEDREEVATDIVNSDVEPLQEGGEYEHFGKADEIDIPDDAAFVYVDSQLGEGDQKAGLEMHVVLDRLYGHAKEISLKSGIFCDEFHYLLRDNTVMESLNHKFRHGRHWDLFIGVASQSYKDLFGTDQNGNLSLTDNAEIMFENMSAQFYLKNDMTYQWGKKLGLSREETSFINEAQVGEVLMRVENTGTYPLEVVMNTEDNPRETVITEYDPSKHGENFAAYLEQHRDICEWSFDPVNVENAPTADIEARNDLQSEYEAPTGGGI